MYSERTQVLLTSAQRARLERLAARRKMSVGAVIREAVDAYTQPGSASREEAAAALFALEAPVVDWETIKAQIARGAGG